MSYASYGGLFAICAVAVVGATSVATRSMNYKATQAEVFLIDRTCKYDRVWTDGKREKISESCNSTDEFKDLAKADRKQRKKVVDGTAVVKVSYTAPQDGSYQTSSLTFDGRDEEFYKLKAGDRINVLVSNDDPAKIIKG